MVPKIITQNTTTDCINAKKKMETIQMIKIHFIILVQYAVFNSFESNQTLPQPRNKFTYSAL
jgi:hypothetical protein